MKRLAWTVLWMLAAAAGGARAQDHSVSYATWMVDGKMVTLRYLLPVPEAQRLLGVEVPVLTTAKLADYLLAHQTVQSAGGDCPAIDQGFDLGRVDPLAVGPDLYGFEIFYRCQDPRQLLLRDTALFGRMPDHVTFAQIQVQGQRIERLFTAQHQQLALPDDRALPATGIAAYLRLGILHVLTNADRWIFLLGALLLVRRRLDVWYLLAAVVTGYGFSLLAASTAWVLPRMPRLEAFMGFLLVLLAAMLTQRETPGGRGPNLRGPAILLLGILLVALLRAPSAAYALLGAAALAVGLLTLAQWFEGRLQIWAGAVTLFAFLDGFALPAVLGPAQLPQRTQTWISLAFDLGAVSIIVLLLGLAIGAWRVIRTLPISLPRAIMHDVGCAALYGLGAFWLLTRID